MNKVRLHISELTDILEFVNKFPDTNQLVITTDNSSGIGAIVHVEIDSVVNGMEVKITRCISDESTW